MNVMRTMACAVLTMSVLAGCDSGGDTTTSGAGAGAGAGAGTAAGTDAMSATPGASDGSVAVPSAAPVPPVATEATPVPAAGSDPATTQPAGAGAAAATTAEAQSMLDQTITYIKDNKLELAEKSLTQLEGLKPRLPVEYHSKIDSVRKAFNAAKTGQGLKLDSLLPGSTGAK